MGPPLTDADVAPYFVLDEGERPIWRVRAPGPMPAKLLAEWFVHV